MKKGAIEDEHGGIGADDGGNGGGAGGIRQEYRESDHRRGSQNGDHAAFGGSDFGTALLRGRGGFLFRAGRYVRVAVGRQPADRAVRLPRRQFRE